MGYEIEDLSGAVNPSESELRKLVEKWPELKTGFRSDLTGRFSKVGSYVDLVNVSRSRMGSVYRGVDKRTQQSVALKFPADTLNTNTLDRFRREIMVTKRLKHPQVVNVID
jgi:serine/threonine protein kinase